jgi:hypothetical protein
MVYQVPLDVTVQKVKLAEAVTCVRMGTKEKREKLGCQDDLGCPENVDQRDLLVLKEKLDLMVCLVNKDFKEYLYVYNVDFSKLKTNFTFELLNYFI